MARYGPSLTAFQKTRSKLQDLKEYRARQQERFDNQRNEMKRLSLTDGGQLLLEELEQEFQHQLNRWLRGDPQDVGLNIECHTRIKQLMYWRAMIDPEESSDAESANLG